MAISLLCYRHVLYFGILSSIPHLVFHKFLYENVLSVTIYPDSCFSSRLTPIYSSWRDVRCLSNLILLKNLHIRAPQFLCNYKTNETEKKKLSQKYFASGLLKSQLSRNEKHPMNTRVQIWSFMFRPPWQEEQSIGRLKNGLDECF